MKRIIDQKVGSEASIKHNELVLKENEEYKDAYFETYRQEQLQERLASDITIKEGIRLEALKLQTLEQQRAAQGLADANEALLQHHQAKVLYIFEKRPYN